MLVRYEHETYRVLNPPVRECVIADFRDVRPTFRLTLELVKDKRIIIFVAIKYVQFQFEW